MKSHDDVLFRLRVKPFTDRPSIGIECVDRGVYRLNGGTKYSLRVTYKRREVFAHDSVLRGSFAPSWSSDSDEARKQAVGHVAMRPGDTDDEFFSNYTPEQIAFCEEFGEYLSLYRERGDA